MHDISLSKLRAFERTVRLGGVHRAADSLGLTQSAVSQRIRELERTLGTKIFERKGRSLQMTPEGAALLVYADQLLKIHEEMALRIQSGDPLTGLLRFGVPRSFAEVCLTELMVELTKRFKSLKFALHVGDSNTLSEMLNRHELDLAITSEHKIAANIHRQKLGENLHGWFAPAEEPFDAGPQTPQSLAAHHIIVTPEKAYHNITVTQWFREADIVPQRLSTCNDLGATIRMVKDGIGIAYLPVRMMVDAIADGTVKEMPVDPPMPRQELSICYQVNEMGPGLKTVVNLLEDLAAKRAFFR